jgi:hypothetical protein
MKTRGREANEHIFVSHENTNTHTLTNNTLIGKFSILLNRIIALIISINIVVERKHSLSSLFLCHLDRYTLQRGELEILARSHAGGRIYQNKKK